MLLGLKALHALFGSYIKEPLISKKREWEYFQNILKKTIPDVATD